MKHTLDIKTLQAKHAVLLYAWKTDSDQQALQEILTDYKPLFMKKIRQTFKGRTLSADHFEDLLQECQMAAIKAIDAFDLDQGTKLTTFLFKHVEGALKRYILDFKAPVRLGTSSDDRKAYYAAQRVYGQKQMVDGEPMTNQDIATVAKDSATSIKVATRAVQATQAVPCSLDSIDAMMADPDPTDAYIDRDAITKGMAAFEDSLQHLPERTRIIILETFLSHKKDGVIDALAQRFGLTPRRVRQLQIEGLGILRSHMEHAGLESVDIF